MSNPFSGLISFFLTKRKVDSYRTPTQIFDEDRENISKWLRQHYGIRLNTNGYIEQDKNHLLYVAGTYGAAISYVAGKGIAVGRERALERLEEAVESCNATAAPNSMSQTICAQRIVGDYSSYRGRLQDNRLEIT